MFSKIIKKPVLISGLYRSYGKNICRLQKNFQLELKLGPCNKRYINTCNSLFYGQRIPKEKLQAQGDKKSEKDKNENQQQVKNEKGVEKDIDRNSKENQQESQEKQVLADLKKKDYDKEKRDDKKWRSYGRQLILQSFASSENKNKETFLECLRMYTNAPGKKVERVLFIYAALKYMEEFGVHKDLQVYKAILNIFPKEVMVPTNLFQTWFMHYPREQYCAVAILEQMEDNAVIPDTEMELILLNIYGSHGLPLQKYWKMMYWMPKFRHKNPWPVPNPIPNDPFELAKLAMIKISSIDVESSLNIFNTEDVEDSIDKTWIVSAMAPKQSELLVKHARRDQKTAIYVEGPFKIYVATECVDYFTLRADPSPDRKWPDIDTDAVDKIRNPYLETKGDAVIVFPSVHEQFDGTIFANCATGTSTKDSLLSWIRCLQKDNPVLAEIPVVFRIRNYSQEKFYVEGGEKNEKESSSESKTDSASKLFQQ